jgi:amino acid adenylation domain-containing protein
MSASDAGLVSGDDTALPLSSVQQLVFLDQLLHPDLPIYNIGMAWHIAGPVDPVRLAQAINIVANGNDALRLLFSQENGLARQRILDSVQVAVPVVDFSGAPDADARARAYMQAAFVAPFKLFDGLAWSSELVLAGEAGSYWFQRYHHLVTDGYGMSIIAHAVAHAYRALLEQVPGAPAGPSYAEFIADDAHYLESARYGRDRDFWLERFARLPAPLLAPRLPQAAQAAPAPSGQLDWQLPRARYEQYAAFAKQHGLSMPHLLLAAIGACFARFFEVDEVVVGVPVHNRGAARQKQTVGMFSSISPVGIRVDRQASFVTLMGEVAAEMRRCHRHQRFPVAELNRALKLSRAGREQLFDLTLSAMSFNGDNHFGDAPTRVLPLEHGLERTPLAIVLRDHHAGAAVTIEFVFNTAWLDQAQAQAIQARIALTLDAAMQAPDTAIDQLPFLSESERRQVVLDFNATTRTLPHRHCIHTMFEEQVARSPDAPALSCGGTTLGYAELNQRANRLAHHLRALGVQADDRVAICVERSIDMIVGLLGILKAGAGYVPLDPAYPAERLAFMLGDCQPAAVLTQAALRDKLPATSAATVVLDSAQVLAALAAQAQHNPAVPGISAAHLAYVIYTSGSTGVPKGVMVEHRNAVNLLAAHIDLCGMGPGDRVLQFASIGFDASVTEIFPGLASGAQIVLRPPHLMLPDQAFIDFLDLQGITVADLPTAFWHQWAAGTVAVGKALRLVIVGGEKAELRHLRNWCAAPCTAGVRWINTYGPTEATIYASAIAYQAGSVLPAAELPIGRPVANTRIYLLDAQGRPVAPGMSGEIHIGGAQVARGYLNRAELTQEKFIPDPYTEGGRLYKSGDLGRWLPDGSIEYLGRNDFQVKIRGYRIELGEIEARLAACPGVREALVMVGADQRLVAYLSTEAGARPSVASLRSRLAQELADYMLPSAFVLLDAFPINTNGKIDRKALPAPDMEAVVTARYEAPQGEAECAIAQIWQQLLSLEQVGRHDHFFELGGHSLLVVSLLEQLRQRGWHTDLRSVFAAPTPAGLARLLATVQAGAAVDAGGIPAGCQAITPDMLPLAALTQDEIDTIAARVAGGAANIADIYALSPLQKGILFHHLLESEGDPYLLRLVLTVDSRSRLDAFLDALRTVIARHDILRTGIAWSGLREPVQVVHRHATLPVEQIALDAGQDALQQLLYQTDPARLRLDLQRAPLLAAWLAVDPVSGACHLALLNHHLIGDHVSQELIVAEIEAILQGEAERLPTPVPYKNFIAQTLATDDARHRDYFRRQLGDIDEVTAPFGLMQVQGNGAQCRAATLALDDALSLRIRTTARRWGVTPAVLFHVAWAQVLGRTSARQDVVFGSVLLGRMQGSAGADRVLGMFVNTLPLRLSLAGASVRQAVDAAYRQLGALLEHEQAPLALAQQCSALAAPAPLFTSLLNYRHSHAQGGQAARLARSGIRTESVAERISYPVTISINDLGEGFSIASQCELVDPARVAAMLAQAMAGLTQALADDPERLIATLDVLPPAERALVLSGFNERSTAYDGEQLIHQLFEAQAQAHPQAIALVFEDQSLTYGELNRRANGLAHRLIALGVRPDDRVAICVGRGLEMVIGLLGILKAGAGYVPLDPAYPQDRLAFTLADCAPVALVSEAGAAASLPDHGIGLLMIDGASDERNPQVAGLSPSHLAYVIYTSGSTGVPKGVMVEHRNVARLFTATDHWFAFGRSDVWTLFHSFAFDFSVWEIWGALLKGGRLVVVPYLTSRSPQDFYQLLCGEGVTVLNQTPSAFRQLIAAQGEQGAAHQLRCVIFGGEALELASLQPWHARQVNAATTLINMYGITETTVHVTYRPLAANEQGISSPIGRQIPDLQIYILDEQRQPLPLGVAGEIYVGGAGVARGYLNRDALTAERFIADPFSLDAGARLYKTGDLGRWLADGNIDYLGRNDFQVKMRGFRIELGEIEARLAACDGVQDAVVLVREDLPGEKRLVAYLLPRAAGAELAPAALRAQLSAHLADYMIPGAFVTLDAFPLTANGKLDRKALPAPDASALIARQFEAPQGAIETSIARIWQDLLGIDAVGRHDQFFELGGHSLLAVQLVGRVRQDLHIDVSLRDLFAQPALADFAGAVARAGGATLEAIGVAERGAVLPLSFAQQRLWFLDQLDSAAGAAYHMPAALRLTGSLDRAALQAALDRIVARHEILRTTFADGQRIGPATQGFALTQTDLRDADDIERAEAAIAEAESGAAFDLGAGPLIRGQLLRLADEQYILLVTQHHIISDGWSVGVLVGEVSALYAAFSAGRDDPLPPLAIQYADYAAWQRAWLQGDVLERQLGFWKTQLEGAPALLELPTDHPRPAVQSYAGGQLDFVLPRELAGALRALGLRHGATLFMTLLAGWSTLLARMSGQDDVVIGTPVANRQRTELEPLIGFFVNTLALRVRLADGLTVAGLLAQVRTSLLAAYEHQDLPFEQVVEALKPARSMSYTPLFQVMIGMNNTPAQGPVALQGLAIASVAQSSSTTHFDLNLALTEADGVLNARLDYASDLFDAPTVARIAACFRQLLEEMVAGEQQPVGTLTLLGAAQRAQLTHGFNDTARDYPRERTIHGMFEAQAAATPEACAVLYQEQGISYAQLNRRANQVAHTLIGMGVQTGDRVALCVERGVAMAIGWLGIMKSGAAYVPIEPEQPAERIAYILADSGALCVLTSAATGIGAAVPVHELDGPLFAGASVADPVLPGLGADAVAYVIYTSGSTGAAKGVMVEHRSAVNFWQAMRDSTHQGCPQPARIGLNASYAFDMSWKGWLQLLSGHCILPVPQEIRADGAQMLAWLAHKRIDVVDSTPSQLDVILAAGLLDDPHYAPYSVLLGGEPIQGATWDRLKQSTRTRFFNMYGPTECTVDATLGRILASDARPHIGRPLANARVYVLDAQLQPVPIGVTGELYIGGDGVARGYLNRPELTAERFVRDPFSAMPGARMYKTGDLGRWLADGNIDYLGRNDFQVKLRGFRIELGEIEAQLLACDGVHEAVVLAREDVPGQQRLVAYLRGTGLSPSALRAHLASRLADYMLPAAYVSVDAFPLNANGKLDRKALPRPDHSACITREFEAPQGATETAVAHIWQDLLGVARIGRHDQFFDLGGHSLMAVQLVARLRRELDVELSLRELFANPALSDFAALVARAGTTTMGAIVPAGRGGPLPLSFAQQRLWFLDRLDHAAGAAYHMPAALRLSGALDRSALQAALDRLVARHEVLRTTFGASQVIGPVDQGLPLTYIDLRGAPDAEGAAAAIADAESGAPFDLARGPLVRGQLLRLGDEAHILLITQHHIVSDGWSIGVLVREVSTLYAAFSAGRDDPLPPLAIQYADYAAWQRGWLQGEVLEQQAAFWRAQLAGAPALLELPTDRARPAVQSYAGGQVQFVLPAALSAALRALGQRHGVTMFMIMLAAWSTLLARMSGQADIVIGMPVANRQRTEIEALLGCFVNTLALRVRLDDEPTVAGLLARVRASTLAAYDHQDLPFEQVVEALKPARSMSYSPLFQAMLSMSLVPPEGALALRGLRIERIEQAGKTTQFDLNLSLAEVDGIISARLDYASALFDAASIERIAAGFEVLLGAMVADELCQVSRLPILGPAQRAQVLEVFNDSATRYPQECLIHKLFERQAGASPDAPALVFGEQTLSYARLNARANQVAHHLMALGVKPDDRVAIRIERGPEMVIGLLGILKAGAAYVPLDPGYPAERLAFMLADCAPAVLLTQESLEAILSAGTCAAAPNPVVDGLSGANLAYVIYTSGSTGMPKGVMNEHHAVANRLYWMQERFALDAHDRVLQKTPFSFDVSVWEFFWPLLAGAAIVLARPEGHKSPEYLRQLIDQARVTTLHFVPSMLQAFTEQAQDWRNTSVKRVFCSGEALQPALRTRFVAAWPHMELHNLYGPTEAAVDVTWFDCSQGDWPGMVPIGRPIANTQIYILDAHGQPVPPGVAGEIHIGGVQVARGYLNRPELTAQRFIVDPFSDRAGARLYKTGDLGRWLADGNVDYLGRNDFQVKIRGFRIELGEIEARLLACAGVREAVVLAREDVPGDQRLVAYLVADPVADPVADVVAEDAVCHAPLDDKPVDNGALAGRLAPAALREALSVHLAAHMIPSAFVTVDAFPLTANGKLDRKALPAPDGAAVISRAYQAPQGALETAIAAIWQALLGIGQVGRHDHFFELGGHSLMVVRVIEQLREQGWDADVRSVFGAPTVSGLAAVLESGGASDTLSVPPNLIPDDCVAITPAMLPLVALEQAQIDAIAASVQGGAANIKDIYPLAPLQKGILFHHMLETDGDPYLLRTILSFDSRTELDAFLAALQQVIERHDILRTAVLWVGLDQPVQVVLRTAILPITQLTLHGGADGVRQMLDQVDPRRMRLDLRRAPLLAAFIAADPDTGEWQLALLNHHLAGDHVTLESIIAEILAVLDGAGDTLAPPVPYRRFIAQTLALDPAAHERYFRALLADVDEPTAPFGLLNVQGSGAEVREAHVELADQLALRIRAAARQHGVTPAVLFHVAWAQVLGQSSGRDEVVFGTVLLGRMQGAADGGKALGMFINTLPVKLSLASASVSQAVAATAHQLGELLVHEQASLLLAQRCSALAAQAPLFTSLFNYRHSHAPAASGFTAHGMRLRASDERVNYPVGVSVDDFGTRFAISAQCDGVDPQRVAAMLTRAVDGLADALMRDPQRILHTLDVLADAERLQVLHGFNDTAVAYPQQALVHQRFEAQAAATPEAVALVCGGESVSYAQLNLRANRLAHYLRQRGVGAEHKVAICIDRNVDLVVGLLGILKAGGAYVPLDPGYPAERLAFMLDDCAPTVLLAQASMADAMPAHGVPVVLLDGALDMAAIGTHSGANPASHMLSPRNLAYVIYTSGSTGMPKGTLIEHRSVLRLAVNAGFAPLGAHDCVAHCASTSFDASTWEVWAPLLNGARLLLVPQEVLLDPARLNETLLAGQVSALWLTAGLFNEYVDALAPAFAQLRYLLVGGDALDPRTVARALGKPRHFINGYGPTECTTFACTHEVNAVAPDANGIPIGRPIANTQVYILDRHLAPVPLGVIGEIHLGGDGLARGYLNRPELSAERFIDTPFGRVYKTGDLGRWLADGTVECLGRNDAQVKIRGFRIELGEIEAKLMACAGVREARVLAREDVPGSKRLVAYLLADAFSPDSLRAQLLASLPDYMVPAAFVGLAGFPLTANGKLDRAALPAPDMAAVAARPYEAPQGDVEMALALIWQELLGLERVGRDDHFFELGGHSLSAVQLMGRVRAACHVELSLKTLFESPLLRTLAASIASMQLSEFMGAHALDMKNELGALTESELLAILAEESLTDE